MSIAVNMFWTGAPLGEIPQLSMASFLRHGHQVRLYHYGDVQNVPKGVEEVDASMIVPRDYMMSLRHRRTGSYALASDYFRMKLMTHDVGLWSDCDMLCLRQIEAAPALFGWEDFRGLSSAILYLAPSSPILRDALNGFRQNHTPDWLYLRQRAQTWRFRLLFRSFGPADLPWGCYGPVMITALAKRHRLEHLAAPTDVFYPVPYPAWRRVYEAGSSFEEYITERTQTIHLWNFVANGERPHPTSAVAKFAREYALI
jgi:hypothetical protein